jgi:hypothetical protein
MTSTEQLQNLVAIRKLKPEPPDTREFNGLLLAAKRMIPDAELERLAASKRRCASPIFTEYAFIL